MSFGFPTVYAQPESLGVPSLIMGDDLKSFSGAKNSIRSVPTIKGFNNGNERFSEVGLKQRDVIMEMTSRL